MPEIPTPPHYLTSYLPVVTADYFGRLQETHADTVRKMPSRLREDVQPWFSDPDKGAGMPLFTTAMNGAFANFLGDAARGEVASREVRAETAIKGALTMGLLSIMRDTTSRTSTGRTPNEVGRFHSSVLAAFESGERQAPSANLWNDGQVAAFGLAQYMSTRLRLGEDEGRKFGLHLREYTQAAERQFKVTPHNVNELIDTADGIGVATARLILRLTEATDGKDYWGGRLIAESIGRQGSYRDHGTMVLSALRAQLPTYATAMLGKAINNGSSLDDVAAALKSVYQERDKLVKQAHVPVDANAFLGPFQHDVHNMAGMLTRRMYAWRLRREIKSVGKSAYLQQVKTSILASAA